MKVLHILGRLFIVAVFVAVGAFGPGNSYAADNSTDIYFFWGDGCPHCSRAKPFLLNKVNESQNLKLHDYEIYYNETNRKLYQDVARLLNIKSSGVPLIIVGDEVFSGYSDAYSQIIDARIDHCLQSGCHDAVATLIRVEKDTTQTTETPPDAIIEHEKREEDAAGDKIATIHQEAEAVDSNTDTNDITLPLLGTISPHKYSLPILTILIAILDGFNPCAMWVLLFLISMLIGMKDRVRMWALGIAFVAASAISYFAFLAAWLNIFIFIGVVFWIKILIGVLALGIGVYYLQQYFFNTEAGCKIAGKEKRHQIFSKIRHVTHERSFWLALIGITIVAFMVNLIELVCSAGLPAIYTGILTTASLSNWQYYTYLVLYTFVFMLDDLIVLAVALYTLQVTGIQVQFARVSHLIGGLLMIVLGILLIFAPQYLSLS